MRNAGVMGGSFLLGGKMKGILLTAVAIPGAARADILVYDTNTRHNLAQQAALIIDPGGTVVANSGNFNALLVSQAWDAVAVDVPSNIPSGGWGALITFVNGGGRAAMAFWDWDNDNAGDPLLSPAFDVTPATKISLPPLTLFDSGTSSVFAGVTMPNSNWHDHWVDDGDEFIPDPGAVGLAHAGNPLQPVMVLGNSGRTIASLLIDEAGDTWLNDGSGVQLWENMLNTVIPAPDSDGDGIPDDEDACPESILTPTIIIDGCDSGVGNLLFEDGCTMADLIAECAEGAVNHGQFVSCVARLTNEWKRAGLITGEEEGRIQSCAARSDIPGDLDGDDAVGVADLVILLGEWGSCPVQPDACPADIDQDRSVGITDLLILLGNWG